jgi:topoisomerase-4 subunit A
MRARWKIEELARGQWRVAVYELPHGTSAKKIMEEIEDLTNPKVRTNKKALTQEQVQNKQLLLSVLDKVVDESDKDQAVRLVFEPKSSRQSSEELMTILLAHTSLESSLQLNMVMISLDGRPRQKPLAEILREWAEFRLGTVRRRCEHRLAQVNDRIHILDGRMIVYLNLDEVIALIRESDEPKQALIERFDLSDRQAEDILEIRLRQLAKMEGIKIERELKQLKDEGEELGKLLGSDAMMRRRVAKEIDEDIKTYGDERRTLIEQAERVVLTTQVVDEPVTVLISKKHWGRTRQGHGLDLAGISFKDGDGLLAAFECRTTDHCIVICSNGRVCSIPVHLLPGGRGDGVPLATLIEVATGAKIVHVLCGKAEQHVLLSTAAGYGFTCTLGNMVGRNKAGKQFISVEGEAILTPSLFTPSENALVVAACKSGRLLAFLLAEMKQLAGGGKGVVIMGMADDDELAAATVTSQPKVTVLTSTGSKDQSMLLNDKDLQNHFGKRARMGKALALKGKAVVVGLQP